MCHCANGPSPNTFDILGAIDKWVEKQTRAGGDGRHQIHQRRPDPACRTHHAPKHFPQASSWLAKETQNTRGPVRFARPDRSGPPKLYGTLLNPVALNILKLMPTSNDPRLDGIWPPQFVHARGGWTCHAPKVACGEPADKALALAKTAWLSAMGNSGLAALALTLSAGFRNGTGKGASLFDGLLYLL